MQNAKDTFYIVLRDRLAALNPERTIVVRDVTRPAVWAEENELVSSYDATDGFCVRWTSLQVDATGAMPLVTLGCQIGYATDGSTSNGGMDRGRLLAAMDAELTAAVNAASHNTTKMNYAASGPGTSPVAMGTNVFWSDVTFGAVKTNSERLERVATVEVFAYEEAGEL